MATLTYQQELGHQQACDLIELDRALTVDERFFVLDHYLASCTTRNASERAHFTPEGLATAMTIDVVGHRILDLGAGIGRLAFACEMLHYRSGRPEIVCVERNPEYVRVGRRVLPEARWICADILDLPDLRADLGAFDTAISNPPFGALPRTHNAPGGYTGRRFEYHAIAVAGMFARHGVFLVPEVSAPFRYSGRRQFEEGTGDAEYRRFHRTTGITLQQGCSVDTTFYEHDWQDVRPRVEIVTTDFTTVTRTLTAASRRRLAACPGAGDGEDGEQLALIGA